MEPFAVLFDMDGVLVDSEPVIEAAARAGLQEFGVHARPEDFIPFVGMGEDRYIGGVAEQYGVPFHLDMKKRVYEIYVQIVAENLKVYSGTLPVLQALADAGIPLALASSADRVKVSANLRIAGIEERRFGVIITGEDVVRKKPYPDIYLSAAEGLGIPPERCIVAEDAVSGVQAAKAAGMRCVAVCTSFSAAVLREAGADAVVGDIGELLQGIRALTGLDLSDMM